MVKIYGPKYIDKFNKLISQASWEGYYHTNDPNETLDIFYKIYNETYEEALHL